MLQRWYLALTHVHKGNQNPLQAIALLVPYSRADDVPIPYAYLSPWHHDPSRVPHQECLPMQAYQAAHFVITGCFEQNPNSMQFDHYAKTTKDRDLRWYATVEML